MNKDFKNFIKNRPQNQKGKPFSMAQRIAISQTGCTHDEDHWCQNCTNHGYEVTVDLGKYGKSTGRIFSNL